MANAAAGVLRRGHRDAAHVPHDLHREPQPARADFRQLGPAAVPAADEPCGTADPLGRAAPRRLDHTGVLHHRPRPGGGQPGPGPGRLHRRHLRRQRADHRDDPGALGNGPQPPGAAALPAAGAGQHLPLAEMDPAPADRRHHNGQLRLLPAAGRRTGPLQPGHSVLRRHPAIPSRRPLGAVLADRQPPRLHLRADRRHAGLGDHHAAAPDGERTGPVPAAVRRDLRAGRLQLAPGGAVLAGGQRAGVHPGLAVHRGQRRGKGAAEACAVDNVRRPQRRELFAGSPQEFASQLASRWAPRPRRRRSSRPCAISTCPSTNVAPMPCVACATVSRRTFPG